MLMNNMNKSQPKITSYDFSTFFVLKLVLILSSSSLVDGLIRFFLFESNCIENSNFTLAQSYWGKKSLLKQ